MFNFFRTRKPKFNNGKDYNAKYVDKNGYNLILSENVRLSLDQSISTLNRNVLVVGNAGAGKSRNVVLPNLLQASCSYVISDPDGCYYQDVVGLLRNRGYDIKVLNAKDHSKSDSYNPLKHIDDYNDIVDLVDCIAKNAPTNIFFDRFVFDAAKTLIASCFIYLIDNESDDKITLSHAYELVSNLSRFSDIMSAILEKKTDEILGENFQIFEISNGGFQREVAKVAATLLLGYVNDDIKKITSSNTIDLRSIGEKKTAVFLIMPSSHTEGHLTSIFYTQAFKMMRKMSENFHNSQLPIRATFVLDDLQTLGVIPTLATNIALSNSNINHILCVPSYSQLKDTYSLEWESIVDFCDIHIHLGCHDELTLRRIVSRLDGLMTLYELNDMPANKSIILIRGFVPFYDTKYPLSKHECYKFVCK